MTKNLSFFFLGVLSCYLAFSVNDQYFEPKSPVSPVLLRMPSENKFTAPVILSSDNPNFFLKNTLHDKVSQYIESSLNSKAATNISYYFKDLENSYWMAVNEDDRYAPASLMKVPIMIAILKQSENDPNLLQKKLTFTENKTNLNSEYYLPEKSLENGKSYTVDELLKYMILYSDNRATILLLSVMSEKTFSKIFTDLGLPLPEHSDSPGAIDYMSAKLYSRLFRVLYNSTYLEDTTSAKALELLSQVDFENGVRIKELSGTTISNKFGERTVYDEKGNVLHRELHDCGLIYKTGHRYVVCVMTKGQDFKTLEKIIQTLSRLTFENLEK